VLYLSMWLTETKVDCEKEKAGAGGCVSRVGGFGYLSVDVAEREKDGLSCAVGSGCALAVKSTMTNRKAGAGGLLRFDNRRVR
jgi:hypothetical protein